MYENYYGDARDFYPEGNQRWRSGASFTSWSHVLVMPTLSFDATEREEVEQIDSKNV